MLMLNFWQIFDFWFWFFANIDSIYNLSTKFMCPLRTKNTKDITKHENKKIIRLTKSIQWNVIAYTS